VQQEPFLFNDTIFKNVEYGLIGTEWENDSKERKKELVEQACQEAFADEFITRLPEVCRIASRFKSFFPESRILTIFRDTRQWLATQESNLVVVNVKGSQ